MSRLSYRLGVALLGIVAFGRELGAQGALLKRRQASVSPRLERITFADSGIRDGDTGSPIKTVEQVSVPFGASFSTARGWTLDVAAAFTTGTVEYDNGATTEINGISDVRVRASGKLLGDGLILSLGANLPTGATGLDTAQLAALRVLAAPALGINLPAFGFGPSGAVGLVGTRLLGNWVGALGLSYEFRGRFSPIAALQAGADPEFDPGNTTRVSLGLEGFVGDSRLSVQGGADFYSDDRLTTDAGVSTLKLGPVISLESSLSFSGTRIRDGRAFGAVRRRASFSRDGETVSGGDGVYFSAGIEGGVVVTRTIDVHIAGDGLVHSGLEVDNTLMTAKASYVGVLLGIRARGASGVFEPFVRVGTGTIEPGTESSTFSAFAAGLTLILRF
ncbi:MAG: hypothetical protein ACT4P7_02640 [Gemmatimonadaceae bacterium]